MVKNVGKRMLSFLLATVMVFTLLPVMPFASLLPEVTKEQTLQVKAATIETVLDGQISITDNQNKITESNGTVTITATGTVISKQTNKVTIINESSNQAELSFDYTASTYNSFTIAGATASASGTYTVLLAAGASLTLAIQSNSGLSNRTATLKLSNFSLTAAAESSSVTIAYDSTFGSVTADGTAVANGTIVENITPTEGVALVATAANGGRFLGWINAADGMLLSTATSYTLHPAADMTVKAVFVGAGSKPWFMVGSITKSTYATGVMGWGKGDCFAIPSGAYLFDDLNAAGAQTAASSAKGIVLMNDGTLSAGTYTIPAGASLLIPFDDGHTMYKTGVGNAGSDANNNDTRIYEMPTPYRTLTLANGANLVINGDMSLSAKHALAQGGRTDGGSPTGKVSFVKMESGSNITVNKDGALYAYGFITGSGTITAKNGATVYENFQIMDFRGGEQSTQMQNGVFPLSQYYVQNIEVPLTLEYGATEYSYTTIYMSKTIYGSSVAFIGPGNAMFNLTSGYVTKRYDGSTDRLIVELNGNMSVSGISMSVGTNKLDSEEYELPVNSNITLTTKSGSKITLAQDVAFLPGSQIIVEQGATCEVNANVYVYDADQWGNFTGPGNKKLIPVTYAPGRTGTRTEATLVDASILVNGTVDGDGYIYTTAGGADIKSTGTGVITLKPGAETVTYQLIQGSGYVQIPLTPAKLKNQNGTYLETAKDVNGNTFVYANGTWKHTTHTEQTLAAVAPTCTTTGLTEGKKCTVCGEILVAQEVISTLEHVAADPVKENIVDATCTTAGSHDMVTYCATCGKELSRTTINEGTLSHTPSDEVIENEVGATCAAAGSYDSVVYCSVCKTELSRVTVVVNPLAHTADDAVKENIVEATCTADGSYDSVIYCSVCKAEISRESVKTDALGHVWTEATCTTAKTCSVCGTTEGNAAGHNYESVVTAPDCINGGYTTYTCSVCGDTYTADETAALGHSKETVSGYAATCTETGLTDGVKCSVCQIVLTEQEEIPALGHDYTSVETKAPTCTEAGELTCTCGTCGDTYTEAITTGGHVYTNDHDSICNGCGETREVTAKVDATLNILKHNLNLEESLGLNFRIEGAAVKNATNYWVEFYKAEGCVQDDQYLTVEKKDITYSNGNYYAMFPTVPSCEMAEKIEAVLYVVDADGVIRCSEVDSYSVKDYLNLMLDSYIGYLNNPTSKQYLQCQIAVELLDYGYEAQKLFTYKVNEPINAGLTEKEREFALDEAPNPVNNRGDWSANNSENNAHDVLFTGCSLDLRERVYSNIKLNPSKLVAKGMSKDDLTVIVRKQATGEVVQTIEGEEFSAHTDGVSYYAHITTIKPADFRTIYTIEVYANGEAVSMVGTYSVESFARIAIDANNSAAGASLAALRYGIAANLYVTAYLPA